MKVTYIETHLGHDMEIGCQRLSADEKQFVVDNLRAGVVKERIIQMARAVNSTEVERINLLTKKDLNDYSRRYNIEQLRHSDDMVATAMKVKEWNAGGRNFAFLSKMIGRSCYYLISCVTV